MAAVKRDGATGKWNDEKRLHEYLDGPLFAAGQKSAMEPGCIGSRKYRALLASAVSGPRNVVVEALDAHVGMKFVGLRRTHTGNCIPVVWVLDCDPMFREGKHEEGKAERA